MRNHGRFEKKIRFRDMFDGRLKQYGFDLVFKLHEKQFEHSDDVAYVVWMNGKEVLYVYADEYVASVTVLNDEGNALLLKINEIFGTKVYDETHHKFWGYETDEEWVAAESTR